MVGDRLLILGAVGGREGQRRLVGLVIVDGRVRFRIFVVEDLAKSSTNHHTELHVITSRAKLTIDNHLDDGTGRDAGLLHEVELSLQHLALEACGLRLCA